MSTYNGSKTLSKSIESILNQSYDDFEFIICDDHSSDNSFEIIKKYEKLDSRIIPIKNDVNLGLQKSLNKCINISKGDFIARMDDDDESLKNRLEIEISYIKANKNISFVGSNILFFSNKKGVYGKETYPFKPSNEDMIKGCQFSHPTILIKSDVIKKVNGYSEDINYYRVEDYELWLRLYSLGYSGRNIQKNLLIYKKDKNSIKNIKFIDRINCFRLIKKYFNILNINKVKYFYIFIPLVKLLIPNYIRIFINYIKYSK